MKNNAWKAALLSGLVFPGLGQIMLRHYGRGIALILAVSFGLGALLVKATQLVFTILGRLESQGREVDMRTISKAANQAFTSSDGLIYGFVLLWITFCWIIGIVDAYRLGKKKDLEQSARQAANRGAN